MYVNEKLMVTEKFKNIIILTYLLSDSIMEVKYKN